MKAIVKIPFKDKVTGKIYKKDEIIEVSKARFSEIKKKGEFIEESAKVKK